MDAKPAHETICRLVGVPDGDVQRLWQLWSGEGGEMVERRHAVLAAVREFDEGERVMGNLVTYGVLMALGQIAEAPSTALALELFARADPAQLTIWADDPGRLQRRLQA